MEKRLLICGSFQPEARGNGRQQTDFRRPAGATSELHFELHALKLAVRGSEIKKADVGPTLALSSQPEGRQPEITFGQLPTSCSFVQCDPKRAQGTLYGIAARKSDPFLPWGTLSLIV